MIFPISWRTKQLATRLLLLFFSVSDASLIGCRTCVRESLVQESFAFTIDTEVHAINIVLDMIGLLLLGLDLFFLFLL